MSPSVRGIKSVVSAKNIPACIDVLFLLFDELAYGRLVVTRTKFPYRFCEALHPIIRDLIQKQDLSKRLNNLKTHNLR